MQILHLWFINERNWTPYWNFFCVFSCFFFIDSIIGDKQRVKVVHIMLYKVMFLRYSSIFKLWIFYTNLSTDWCLGNISFDICCWILIIRRALCSGCIRKCPFELWIYSSRNSLNFNLINRELCRLVKYVIYENIL